MSKNGPHNLPDGCREKKKPKNGPFFEKQGDFISKVVFMSKIMALTIYRARVKWKNRPQFTGQVSHFLENTVIS